MFKVFHAGHQVALDLIARYSESWQLASIKEGSFLLHFYTLYFSKEY